MRSPASSRSPRPGWSAPLYALVLALLVSACSAHSLRPEVAAQGEADPWDGWARDFDRAISLCVRAGEDDCLPRAFARPRPLSGSGASAADRLYRDLRTAKVLLRQEDAAALLAREYGIDPRAYLGTGYSVPVTGPGAYDYEHATQREFFVPNLCGDPDFCAPADPEVWIWKLAPTAVDPWLDAKMHQFAERVPPTRDTAGFRDALAATGSGGANPERLPLLVRFAIFPGNSYRGTFARPGTERVFFANFERLGESTLREALIGTGATALVDLANGKANPQHTFFMWVHRPGSGSDVRPATWDAVFDALEERRPTSPPSPATALPARGLPVPPPVGASAAIGTILEGGRNASGSTNRM